MIKDLCAARKEDRIHSAQQLILYFETALEMNIREEEERIDTIFNTEFYDKEDLLTTLQDEYLNFCLRNEKRTGMFNSIISENGNGKTQLLDAFNVKTQLTRIPSLFITIESEDSIINIFYRKLIFGLSGFLEKNERSKEIFIEASSLVDEEGQFKQDRDIVFKVRKVLKDIFDNISTKQSVVLIVDDITNFNTFDKELFTYFLNLAVVSPIFLLVSVDIDIVDSVNCKMKEYEDIYYLIPPKRYYMENLG